jgi:DNA-binding CsgD family transcriptional regulator
VGTESRPSSKELVIGSMGKTPAGRMAGGSLLGRERECARVDELLSAASEGRGGALLIRGEAGTGKSALLRYAAERARANDLTVREARAVRDESNLPFAGLSALLRPLAHQLEQIPPLQASALAGALVLGRAIEGDRFRANAGTLSLLGVVAGQRPLACLVDDVHWLDPDSLAALLFAARRLDDERVALFMAARRCEARERTLDVLPNLTVAGLDRRSSGELLRRRSGVAVAKPVSDRVHQQTAGNPLAIAFLAGRLTQAQLAGREPVADPLPTAGSIERTWIRRIKRLPHETQRAMLILAAGGSQADAISSALRRLGISTALEPAESAGLVTVTQGTVRFSHPLIRSSVYHTAHPAKRRAAHAVLARVLEGQPDRSAWHLAAAATGPDEAVAETLEQAAAGISDRGAHELAGSALERAARLTTDGRRQAKRLLAAAREAWLAGRIDAAMGLLDRALPLARDARLRADVQRLRAEAEMWKGVPLRTHRLLVEEAGRVRPVDGSRAASMLADSALPAFLAADGAASLAAARRAARLNEHDELARAALGLGLLATGQRRKARRVLIDARHVVKAADPLGPQEPFQMLGGGLMLLGEHAHARKVVEHLVSAARAASAPGILPVPLVALAELDFQAGRWAEAYSGATESVRLAEQTGQAEEVCLLMLALVESGLGHEAACRDHATSGLERAQARGTYAIVPWAHVALGSLELSLGEAEQAVVEFERAIRIWEPVAFSVRLRCGADLVEAYRNVGRRTQAAHELRTLKALARDAGAAVCRPTITRSRALLAGDGRFDGAYRDALRLLRGRVMPFELGRTELSYGERLRRARRFGEARPHLQFALDAFETLGASLWAKRVRAELRAMGAPHHPPADAQGDQLTPRELEVALVVARGATNKEAAASLFLSPKTIDFHLRRIYRKLGVRSRVDLARLLLRPEEDAASSSGPAREPPG